MVGHKSAGQAEGRPGAEVHAKRGGTLVQHGSSHQYGKIANPYDGTSGSDYEFIRSQCTTTKDPPFRVAKPCKNDDWVQLMGPLKENQVADHKRRIEMGRQVMLDAGLGNPQIFETPHYAASANAYRAMAQTYDYRYEAAEYYVDLLSGKHPGSAPSVTQYFPYRVHDIYGTTVLPENLNNISKVEQNHHKPRGAENIVHAAKANLVVRESTASFFFHPFLPIKDLRSAVEGVRGLGYTFVPALDLR